MLAALLAANLSPAVAGDLESASGGKTFSKLKPRSVEFAKDVRPLLAKHCFTCHGPDEGAREAGLRLDTQQGSRADLGGYQAVVPGDPDASELMIRVTSEDEGMRMPPADSHPALDEASIALLRSWIESGADYEMHWSFVPPRAPAIPALSNADWCRTPIDRFVLSSLESAGLTPSAEASKSALIRRVTLDLTGVVPTPREVERFVHDDDPDAYRELVDRLLASPDYAERFARPWLDLARYADTNGYEKDRPRTMWPYRDWVIGALTADMPFDQFTVEQLAGDMLPDATVRQQIATGFHRNTMLNEEGGIDPLEYRWYAVVDRVATTGTVWMGLTVGCAQCHTHKYDPISHKDYYSLFALFNGADEPELELAGDALMSQRSVAAERQGIEQRVAGLERKLIEQHLPSWDRWKSVAANDAERKRGSAQDGGSLTEVGDAFVRWAKEQMAGTRQWRVLRPASMNSTMPRLQLLEDGSVLASGDATKRDIYRLHFERDEDASPIKALRLDVLPHESLPAGGPGLAFYEGRRGDFFLSELSVRVDGQEVDLRDASHSYGNISVGSGNAKAGNVLDGNGSTGWSTSGEEGTANRLIVNLEEPIEGASAVEVEMLFERHFAASLGRFRISATAGATPVTATAVSNQLDRRLARIDDERIDQRLYRQLQLEFVRQSPKLKEQRAPIERLRRSLPEPPRTLVMQERPPQHRRVTHRHHRGEYLKPKERVQPGIPELFTASGDAEPKNRLAFARWLASEKNPLFARVTVNRAWRQFFGTGIVRTAGDFGTQSEPPSHPHLLDWLALDWLRHGTSMKRLHRQIVLSATYRQALGPAPDSDPDHRLLSAMPYRRLDAERVRDLMLAASGLMVREVGGASVRPPQPASVNAMAYGSPKWNASQGGDRYRRSLYTFSKRTAPFAAYATFDAPTGELCIARRDRSTTPLQALTLLNDKMYLEIAEGLAKQVTRELPREASPRLIATRMFRRLLTRQPEPEELKELLSFYRSQAAKNSAGAGQEAKLHAWTLVARALMNTDEAITTP